MNFDGREIGKLRASLETDSRDGEQQTSNSLRAGPEQKSFDRRDVKCRQIRTAKGTVGWTAARDRVRLEHPAFRRKHVDHGAGSSQFPSGGGDDISFRVQA